MRSRLLKGHGFSRAVSAGSVPALAAEGRQSGTILKNKAGLQQRTSEAKAQIHSGPRTARL